MQLLIDSLDIINKCDVTYRTSNNKRLALEIPLVQICRLSGQMNMQAGIRPPVIQNATPAELKPAPEPVVSQSQVIAEPLMPVAAPVPEAIPEHAPTPVTVHEVAETIVAEAIPQPETAVAEAMPQSETPVMESSNQTEKPAAEAILNTDIPAAVVSPQPETSKVSEPVEETVHDVPVQSHHRSSFSIKSVMHADQLAGSVKADVVKDRTGTFTFEQIEESLLRFAELKRADSALFYAALTSYKPVLQPDNVLLLTVGNSVLAKELNERRNLLLEFLREELKNDFITMEIQVTEQQSETKKYMTDRDKLDAMAARNPNVKKLKDQLNLELDL